MAENAQNVVQPILNPRFLSQIPTCDVLSIFCQALGDGRATRARHLLRAVVPGPHRGAGVHAGAAAERAGQRQHHRHHGLLGQGRGRSRHVTSRHVASRRVTSRHVMSRHATSGHVTSRQVTSRQAIMGSLAKVGHVPLNSPMDDALATSRHSPHVRCHQ